MVRQARVYNTGLLFIGEKGCAPCTGKDRTRSLIKPPPARSDAPGGGFMLIYRAAGRRGP